MKTVDTVRTRAFIEHPDALLDPVKAAMEVGYSESNARGRGYELRKQHLPDLMERMRARLEGLAVTPDWVKNEVKIIADTTMSDFIEIIETVDGNQVAVLKQMKDIDPRKWRAAVKEVQFDTVVAKGGQVRSRICELKLYDRQAALVELGNLLGLKNDKLFSVVNAPAEGPTDADRLLEFMTESELETMAEIQEKAAARMRREANKRRDSNAIESQSSEVGGSQTTSAPSGSRTVSKRKAVRLPPKPTPMPKD